MQFTRLRLRLGAADVLDLRERQHVAQLRGIENVCGSDGRLAVCLQTAHRDAAHAIDINVSRYGYVSQHRSQLAARPRVREHLVDHGNANARLVTELAHVSAAGADAAIGAGLGREWIVIAVILPHAFAERAIPAGAAE